MPSTRPAAALLLVAAVAAGQDRPAVEKALDRFASERQAAVERPGTADAVAAASKIADKASAALAAGDLRAATRLARDARWSLPARPADLPPHVGLVLGSARLRHADRVNALAYSPDGTKLASASQDGSVRIWDLGNGTELRAYRDHPAPKPLDDKNPLDDVSVLRVPDVAWSPDGKRIASAGVETVHVWDAATGKIVHALRKHTRMVKGVAWSPDGSRLASIADDRQLVVWDAAAGKDVYAVTQPARMDAVAFGPKGDGIAAVDAEGFVAVFTPDGTKPPVRVLASDQRNVGLSSVSYTPDGARLLVSGADRVPKLIAVPGLGGTAPGETATVVMKYPGHTEGVPTSALTPDGKTAVTASTDRTIRVWDAAGGKPLRQLQGHLDAVTAVVVRPDGRQIASGGADGIIKLWDLSTTDDHTAAAEAAGPVWSAAVSPDGKLFAAGGADKTVRIYDARGKLLHNLTGHKAAVTSVAFLSPALLVTAGGDRVIKLWETESGELVRDLAGHTSAVLGLASLPGGSRFLSAAADKTVKAWDADTGKVLWSWNAGSLAASVAVSADGSRAAVGTADGTLTVLDIARSEPTVIGSVAAHISGVAAVSFAADGRLATAGGDGLAKVWAVNASGPPTATNKFEVPPKPGAVNAVAALSAVGFSPDGRQVVAAGADGIVRVFDLATGAPTRELRGHTDWVTAAAFTPDADKLLAAGADKAVRVFDLGRSEYMPGGGHVLPTKAVAVSPDGKRIASAAADKTVKVWDAVSGKEILTLGGLADAPHAVAFVGNTKLAVGGDEQKLRLWELPGGRELKPVSTSIVYSLTPTPAGTLAVWSRTPAEQDEFYLASATGEPVGTVHTEKGRKASCAAFTADGSLVAIGDERGEVRLLDVTTGKPTGDTDWKLAGKTLSDIALTADKKTLFALDAAGTLHIADVAARKVTKTVPNVVTPAPDGWAVLLASADGQRVAAVGADGAVKAFAADGSPLRDWKLPGPVNGAAFAPDGKSLVTANADGTVYRLDLP